MTKGGIVFNDNYFFG